MGLPYDLLHSSLRELGSRSGENSLPSQIHTVPSSTPGLGVICGLNMLFTGSRPCSERFMINFSLDPGYSSLLSKTNINSTSIWRVPPIRSLVYYHLTLKQSDLFIYLVVCFVINVLNNRTIILLNLAEYRLILANSA